MISHIKLNDNEFLKQIENCSLKPELFSHEAQLRLSWILINKYGLEVANLKACKIKEQFYKKALNSNKFNLPLTKAYTEILHYFMEKSSTKNFNNLLMEFPRLKHDFKKLVKTHYGFDILKKHRNKEIKPLETILFTF